MDPSVARKLLWLWRGADRLAWWATLAVAGASALATLASLSWFTDLFVHFRVQYAALALLAAALLALARRLLPALAALALAALNAWIAAPLLAADPPPAPAPAPAGASLRIASSNVFFLSGSYSLVSRWVRAVRPDVLVLIEVTPRWTAALAPLAREYPYQVLAPPSDSGVWLLSRLPLRDPHTLDLGPHADPAATGSVEVGGRSVRIVALHASWPLGPMRAAARDRSFAQLAHLARTSATPVVLVGDFNISAFSPHFAALAAEGGLVDAAQGRGWLPTWPTFFTPAGIAIDHALVSRRLAVKDFRLGAGVGSDHRPIILDVAP